MIKRIKKADIHKYIDQCLALSWKNKDRAMVANLYKEYGLEMVKLSNIVDLVGTDSTLEPRNFAKEELQYQCNGIPDTIKYEDLTGKRRWQALDAEFDTILLGYLC